MHRMPKDMCRESQKYFKMYEHSTLAHRQWSRLIDSMLSSGPDAKGTPVPAAGPPGGTHHPPPSFASDRPTVDPAITRLLERHDATNAECFNVDINNPPAYNVNKQLLPPRWPDDGDARTVMVNGFNMNNGEMLTDRSLLQNGDTTGLSEDYNPDGQAAWRVPNKIYPPGLPGLYEEMLDFNAYITPCEEEKAMRVDVIERFKQSVLELWPDAKVEVFGSFQTDLYLPTSDIDLVVLCRSETNPHLALTRLENQLSGKGLYDDIKLIKSSVPIVKFVDRESAIKVDVGWNAHTGSHLGTQGAQFIKEKIREFHELPILVFVLKQCLLYHNLLESFNGGISSYCLILLIVSYLQLHGEDRVRGHAHMLIRFLELYGHAFNYTKTGIRIRDGGKYFNKDENSVEIANRYSLLCIEDPLNPSNNVGQACFGVLNVREAFQRAYKQLAEECLPQLVGSKSTRSSSILGGILLIPNEICAYRRIIKERMHGPSYCVVSPPLSYHPSIPQMIPLRVQIEGTAAGHFEPVTNRLDGSSSGRSERYHNGVHSDPVHQMSFYSSDSRHQPPFTDRPAGSRPPPSDRPGGSRQPPSDRYGSFTVARPKDLGVGTPRAIHNFTESEAHLGSTSDFGRHGETGNLKLSMTEENNDIKHEGIAPEGISSYPVVSLNSPLNSLPGVLTSSAPTMSHHNLSTPEESITTPVHRRAVVARAEPSSTSAANTAVLQNGAVSRESGTATSSVKPVIVTRPTGRRNKGNSSTVGTRTNQNHATVNGSQPSNTGR